MTIQCFLVPIASVNVEIAYAKCQLLRERFAVIAIPTGGTVATTPVFEFSVKSRSSIVAAWICDLVNS